MADSPGPLLTRTQLAAAVHVTVNVIEGLEKIGALQPTTARPIQYSPADRALAAMLLAARQLGLSGSDLTRIGQAVGPRLRQRPLEWRGYVLVGTQFIELHTWETASQWVNAFGHPLPPTLILPVTITPIESDDLGGG